MNTLPIISRINELCNQKNVSVNQMLQDAGLSKSIVDNLKKGSIPSADKILTVAQYFEVSTDYLLTGASPPASSQSSLSDILTPQEVQLAIAYRNARPELQAAIKVMLNISDTKTDGKTDIV